MQSCQIFVISLADSPRRAQFETQDSQGLEWSFFDAHRGISGTLKYDDRTSKAHHGRHLRPGELGCFSSHYAIWNAIAASGFDAVVLEDDVIVDWNFLKNFLAEREKFGFDYVRFYARRATKFMYVKEFLERYFVEYLGHPFGTQGYYLSNAGAKKLISKIDRIVRPVDDELDRSWANGLPNIAIYPHPLIEMGVSHIGDRSKPVDENGWWSRVPRRIIEKLWKTIYFAGRRLAPTAR